jgi:hypothetical protein
LNPEPTIIAVIDCSFLKKSGKKTEGKAYFYNGIARTELNRDWEFL